MINHTWFSVTFDSARWVKQVCCTMSSHSFTECLANFQHSFSAGFTRQQICNKILVIFSNTTLNVLRHYPAFRLSFAIGTFVPDGDIFTWGDTLVWYNNTLLTVHLTDHCSMLGSKLLPIPSTAHNMNISWGWHIHNWTTELRLENTRENDTDHRHLQGVGFIDDITASRLLRGLELFTWRRLQTLDVTVTSAGLCRDECWRLVLSHCQLLHLLKSPNFVIIIIYTSLFIK